MTAVAYGVLGAGRQGTAAAYDLVVHGGADAVVLADSSEETAAEAAERVRRLTGSDRVRAGVVDATDVRALASFLEPLDTYVCAVPFALIPTCTDAAIRARTHMVDLGGLTETVLGQLARHAEAAAAGVTIVPDCGMGPGLNNTLGMYVYEMLGAAGAQPVAVHLYDGGLPQDRDQPWGYRAAFNIEGLTNEYEGHAVFLRGGEVTMVETLTEPELLDFGELGLLEAFVTSGGTSTVPYTLEGRLDVYENKTLRYPGHLAAFKAFKDLGLFERSPITVEGAVVSPRAVYHALLRAQIESEELVDICVMRARSTGILGERRVELIVDLVDRYDPASGFTAMERLTGWHAAIMAEMVAGGNVPPGVHPCERAVPAVAFMHEVRRRGFHIEERWETS